MARANPGSNVSTRQDGTQPYALTIPVHVVSAAEIADMEARIAAAEREQEARNARQTAFARKVGLRPRRRHPLRTRPVRTARPRGAGRPRARARRTSSSSTSSGADPGGDEPALAGPSPRFSRPWRPRSEALLAGRLAALDGLHAPAEQLGLDLEAER